MSFGYAVRPVTIETILQLYARYVQQSGLHRPTGEYRAIAANV
jgi:hypothetical protein